MALTQAHWKSKTVKGYTNIHKWMRNVFGSASTCENCHGDAKRYEWANISGKYLKDRVDWKQLCASCHKKMDYTEEMRERNRLNHLGQIRTWGLRPVVQFVGSFVIRWPSISKAAKDTGISRANILSVILGRSKTAGGYVWKYEGSK